MIGKLSAHILALFIFTLCAVTSNAQQNQAGNEPSPIIDSLLLLLKTDKQDTNRLFHLYQIADECETIGNYPDGLKYGKQTLEFADILLSKPGIANEQKVQRFAKKYKAKTYNIIGLLYFGQGNYPEALKNHFASLKIMEAIDDKKGVASSYNNIGIINEKQGNTEEALKYYLASLNIKKAIGDKRGIASAYNNIGNLYYARNDYPDALKNYFAALEIYKTLDTQKGIADTYNNMALVYSDQALREENPVLRANKFDEALKNHFASLKIKEAIDDKAGIATSYGNIGNVFSRQKKYKEAEEYHIKALELAKQIGHKEYLRDAYSDLSNLDSIKGNFKGAYHNHKRYILYRDSLDNEQNREKTIQSKLAYEFEKKEAVADAEHKKELENQNVLAEEKSRKQKAVLVFVLIGLLLVLVFSGFIFRSLRITRKQKNIIEQQKQEVEHQKILVDEHQKEIIDSITYAKRLQEAILPSNEEIKKYLPDSFVLYKPKDIVAGDFYWMETIDNIILIAAADCTGHGVPGAMVSVVCSNALNRSVKEFGLRETGKILDKVTDLVLETFEKSSSEVKDGMDISLLAYNKTSRRIQWSGANNSLVYFQNGSISEVKADKQPIGKHDNRKPFITHTIDHSENSVFYLFTDGFPDQFGGEKGKKFMYKRFEGNLSGIWNMPMDEQHLILEKTFHDWKGSLEQVDDVTVIGIKI